MTDDQHIHIHNDSMDSGSHLFRVIATFLLIIGAVAIGWGFAQNGMLDLVAVVLTATLSMQIQLMLRNGIIVLPDKKSDDERIEAGKSAARDIMGAFKAILDRSSLLRITLIAIGYGLLFGMVRAGIQLALGTWMSNLYLALGTGAVVASAICFPTLFVGMYRAMKARSSVQIRTQGQPRVDGRSEQEAA